MWSKVHIDLPVKYSLFLLDFNENWIFSTDFKKITRKSNLMKIRPVGAELLHADRRTDGQTDMMNLIVAFLNFANVPNADGMTVFMKFFAD
jgi:hypothetical protein